jgi:hypothetical protein
MPCGKQDRLAAHVAVELQEAITEPEKVIAPIATPSPNSIRLTGLIGRRTAGQTDCREIQRTSWSNAAVGNAEGFRVKEAAAPTSTAAMPTSE